MKFCESFLLAKNGLSKLKQLAMITFLLVEYINLILYVVVYILDMKSCESFLVAKNGLSKLKQLAFKQSYGIIPNGLKSEKVA